jgi:hypothetical protein
MLTALCLWRSPNRTWHMDGAHPAPSWARLCRSTRMALPLAILALGMVVFGNRQLSPQQSLGVAAIATLLISPYEYDYDLLALGIGLRLLLTDLTCLGTERERLALYALSLFIGLFNLAQNVTSSKSTYTPDDAPLSLSGLALVAILVLTWRILLRSYQRRGERGLRRNVRLRPCNLSSINYECVISLRR